MKITEAQLAQQVKALGNRRLDMVSDLAHEGESDGIGAALLLALGSRETNMRNIAGDGGHGRGWLQIDDRFHREFLATHRGCDSGSFTPTHDSAAANGRVPTLTAGTIYAIGLLRANMRFARSNGVPEAKVLRFASPPTTPARPARSPAWRRAMSTVARRDATTPRTCSLARPRSRASSSA